MLQYIQTLILILSIAYCGLPTRGSLRPPPSQTDDIEVFQSDTCKCDDKGNEVLQTVNMPIGLNTSAESLASPTLQDNNVNFVPDEYINTVIRNLGKAILVSKYTQKFIYQHFVDRSQSTDDEMIKSNKELMEEFAARYEKLSKDNWSVLKSRPSKEIMDMIELTNEQQLKVITFCVEAFLSIKKDSGTVDSAQSNNELSAMHKRYLKFYYSLMKLVRFHFKDLFGCAYPDRLGFFPDDEDLNLDITDEEFYKFLDKVTPLSEEGVKLLNDFMQRVEDTKKEPSTNPDIATVIFRMLVNASKEDNERVLRLLFDYQNASESISDTLQDTNK